MEDVKIKAFLTLSDGPGYGDGYGDGYGYGSGSGSGYGSGDGSGCGCGSGDGYGSGYGSGSGGLFEINGHTVYMVDRTPTIFTSIHGNVAKGFILQSDLTMTPCYIVKGNNMFAHGDDLRNAMEALRNKMFEDMPEEERIAAFLKALAEEAELIRALQYDRQQYDKGYQDAMDSIVRCKDCKHMENREFGRYCNAWVMYNGAGDDGFCNYGEKKENPAGMADNQ